MVSQSDVLNAMRSAERPVTTTEIAVILGPQSNRDRSSVVGEVAARCSALRRKGEIERCEGNTWGVVE